MSRRYELRLTSHFDRNFRQLDEKSQLRAAREILKLESDPLIGKALHGELKGLRSLRIGDYRVIYEISGGNVVLTYALIAWAFSVIFGLTYGLVMGKL